MSEQTNFFDYMQTLDQQEAHRYSRFSRYLEARARETNTPLFGQFELTPLCNLDCKMCYVHLHGDELKGRSPLTVAQWQDIMRQAFDAGMYEAALTGGECLTYPGFEELYLFLQDLGCQVTLMSNGALLNEEKMAFFREHPPALVQITLYGPSEDAYERVTGRRVFQQTLEHIRQVKEAGFALMLTVTPNPYLGEDVFETIRLARSLTPNVEISTSLFVTRDGPQREQEAGDLTPEDYARILRFDRELRGLSVQEFADSELPAPGGPHTTCDRCGLECGGGRSSFVVDWQGRMRICNRMEVTSEPLRVGFRQAWQTINAAAVSWPRVPECQGCPYERVCNKCAARMMQYAEPGKRPPEVCGFTRYMVSRGVLSPPVCD